jgi:hypothetical protein
MEDSKERYPFGEMHLGRWLGRGFVEIPQLPNVSQERAYTVNATRVIARLNIGRCAGWRIRLKAREEGQKEGKDNGWEGRKDTSHFQPQGLYGKELSPFSPPQLCDWLLSFWDNYLGPRKHPVT